MVGEVKPPKWRAYKQPSKIFLTDQQQNCSGYAPQKRKRERQKSLSFDQERCAVCGNSGEADAVLEFPCMTMQTSRAASAVAIVPSVIAKNAKAPLLMHSTSLLYDALWVEHSSMTVL